MGEPGEGTENSGLYVPPSAEVAEAEAAAATGDRQIGVHDEGTGNDESANGAKPAPNCVAVFAIVVKFDGNCDILYNVNELAGRSIGSVPQQMATPKMIKDTCRDITDFFERDAVVNMIGERFPQIMQNAAMQAYAAQQEAAIRNQLQRPPGG